MKVIVGGVGGYFFHKLEARRADMGIKRQVQALLRDASVELDALRHSSASNLVRLTTSKERLRVVVASREASTALNNFQYNAAHGAVSSLERCCGDVRNFLNANGNSIPVTIIETLTAKPKSLLLDARRALGDYGTLRKLRAPTVPLPTTPAVTFYLDEETEWFSDSDSDAIRVESDEKP